MKELTIPYVFDVIFRFLNARIKDKVFGGIFRTYFDIYDKNGLAEDYTANKLTSGKKGIPAELHDFYMEEENLSSLVDDISENLLPYISQKFRMCDEFKETAESSLLNPKDADLLIKFYPETENDVALFIAKVILFAMNNKSIDNSGSPDISQRIILPNISPCKYFSGREKELSALDEMLKTHDKVFVYGIGGIGKSEFVKKYISLHKKDFRNVLYITYADSIKSTVAGINFLTDKKEDTISQLYTDHLNYLRLLRNDTLIVIDNFDILPEADINFNDITELDCKIIFATRNHFGEEYATFPLVEMDENEFMLIAKELNINETADSLSRLFNAVHKHTLSGELILRLLKRSAYTADELLEHLHNEHIKLELTDKIRLNSSKPSAPYYEHIRLLFNMLSLPEKLQATLRILSLMPSIGIGDRYFKSLTESTDMNDINELDEMGLLHYHDHTISIHPLIAEIAAAELKPDMNNCRCFLDNILLETRIVIDDRTNRVRKLILLPIADNVIRFTIKKDISYYIYFLNSFCTYAQVFEDIEHMNSFICEVDAFIDDTICKTLHIVHYINKAAYAKIAQKDNSAAIKLTLKAAEYIPDLSSNDKNSNLIFNIYNNLLKFYLDRKDIPRALKYGKLAGDMLNKHKMQNNDIPIYFRNMSEVYFCKKDFASAISYINSTLQIYYQAAPQSIDFADALIFASKIYSASGDENSAQYLTFCAKKVLGINLLKN